MPPQHKTLSAITKEGNFTSSPKANIKTSSNNKNIQQMRCSYEYEASIFTTSIFTNSRNFQNRHFKISLSTFLTISMDFSYKKYTNFTTELVIVSQLCTLLYNRRMKSSVSTSCTSTVERWWSELWNLAEILTFILNEKYNNSQVQCSTIIIFVIPSSLCWTAQFGYLNLNDLFLWLECEQEDDRKRLRMV